MLQRIGYVTTLMVIDIDDIVNDTLYGFCRLDCQSSALSIVQHDDAFTTTQHDLPFLTS